MDYITIDDIRHDSIKAYPDTDLQPFVDLTNNWYESFAKSKGITNITDIAFPVPGLVMDLLVSKLQWEFAKSKIGGNNATPGDNDLYFMLMGVFQKDYTDTVVRVTYEMIKGEENIYSNTTVYGTRTGAYGTLMDDFDLFQPEN